MTDRRNKAGAAPLTATPAEMSAAATRVDDARAEMVARGDKLHSLILHYPALLRSHEGSTDEPERLAWNALNAAVTAMPARDRYGATGWSAWVTCARVKVDEVDRAMTFAVGLLDAAADAGPEPESDAGQGKLL